MSNDFKDLKGLPPEAVPHDSKPVPNELEYKHIPTRENDGTDLNLSDYWNIIKAIFRNEALAQIEGKSYLYETALNIRYIGMCLVAVLVAFLLIKLFV